NQQNDHDGGQLHDPERFLAGFADPFDVLPPEIDGDENGESHGGGVGADRDSQVRVGEQFSDQASQGTPGAHAANGAGENVIEHQGGYREFGESTAHRFFDDAVDTPTHEHAATFHIQLRDRVGKQHGGKDEPRSGLADELLGFTARVEG